jgi:Na+/H+ antiporter NhaD/arsenite permease-like protein
VCKAIRHEVKESSVPLVTAVRRGVAAPGLLLLLLILVPLFIPAAASAETSEAAEGLGSKLPLWSVIPFAGILLSIAFFPLFAPRWWHAHFPKVSAFWAMIFAVPFVIVYRGGAAHEILVTYLHEYLPFIILLWALFTVAGGVHVGGAIRGTPERNVLMLAVGTLIASWVGTTGASMILIRPILRANGWRKQKVHVIIFFIFLVANVGGALTPLGDPPLFLGFLLGVPFFWTLHLIPHMLLVAVPLLVIFYIVDRFYYRREQEPAPATGDPVRIEGTHNLLILLGVVGAVLISGLWNAGETTLLGVHLRIADLTRDVSLLGLGALSIITTRKQIREDNGFSWFPIKEVAILFAGIFTAIIPALLMLEAGEAGSMGFVKELLDSPAQYFWITGALSSFLDNAPSYLTIVLSCLGDFYAGVPAEESIHMLIRERAVWLKGISAAAVFWGALTYIGNAPNFMVKSIAEEAGVHMPSFFGFMFRYSIPVLIPLYVLVTIVFF